MIHLFKHPKTNFFDFAFVVGKNYICGSNQGYERKAGVYKAMRSLRKYFNGETGIDFQDNTGVKPVMMRMYRGKIWATGKKPKKPYIPSTKK